MSATAIEVSTLVACVTLERKDGAGVALTSHERPLTCDGARYEPTAGLVPSAMQTGDGGSPIAEISWALDSGALSHGDLSAGRWDGARLTLNVCSWERPGEKIELCQGRLGEVLVENDSFTTDVLGRAARKDEIVCPITSPECRANLGDKRCRVDLASLRSRAIVTQVIGNSLTLDRVVGDDFLLGQVRFLSGPLTGMSFIIVGAAGTTVRLREPLSLAAATPARVELTTGCDKRAETCRSRFDNMINFRGEPGLPGTDYLMRYPGQ